MAITGNLLFNMIRTRPLYSKDETGREMYRMIRSYSPDLRFIKVWNEGRLVPITSLPINRVFDMVRKIPYRRDTKPIEVVTRPAKILKNRLLGMDCKKKAILISSYCRERGIPYRLIASSRLPSRRIHHVFPQVNIGGWVDFDATYPHYRPFQKKTLTRREVLQW